MAFLYCDGYKIEHNCTPFNNKGHLKYDNGYDVMNWSDRPKPNNPGQLAIPLDNTQKLTQFIRGKSSRKIQQKWVYICNSNHGLS